MSSLGLAHIADEPEDVAPVKGSALDRIRNLYQREEAKQVIDLPVPRTAIMGVRYHAVDMDEIRSNARTLRDAHLDILGAACECIIVRDGEKWEPLPHVGPTPGWSPLMHDGEPVRFDETLSEIAGLGVPSLEDGGTVRQVVREVFRKAPAPHLAIAAQVDSLSEWMVGGDGVDEEELLGES